MKGNDVEKIKQALSIETVISQYLKIEKAGMNFRAKCPFHNEKTPSFYISPDRNSYYCFGCNAHGDIFSFIENIEGIDFKGALKILADKANITLSFRPDQNSSEKDRIFEVLEEATRFFEKELENNTRAMEYLKNRGLTDQTIKDFRIGYAPELWNSLHKYLNGKKYTNDLINKAGLIKSASEGDGRMYDRFRGRIMFPIEDSSGRVIAFTGRILNDDGKSAKYLNSPDTPVFDKSSTLFGLSKAKTEIRRLDYSILVEGQMDLIMSHQAQIRNTVASSGTALTALERDKEGQINNLGLIKRLSNNIVIAFDSDNAGRKAALRASMIALSLGMDVKIADIVGGKDPADLIKENKDKWVSILKNTKSIIEFELDNVINETLQNKRILPGQIVNRVLSLVALLQSHSEQSFYIKMISEKSQIGEQALIEDLKKVKLSVEKDMDTKPTTAKQDVPVEKTNIIERRLIGLIYYLFKDDKDKLADYSNRLKAITLRDIDFKNIVVKDYAFEAEINFGSNANEHTIEELFINLEVENINNRLSDNMSEIRKFEKVKDHEKVSELAKSCQILSIRKAQLAKMLREGKYARGNR